MNDRKQLARALAHHKRGAFTEALRLYSELFDRNPGTSIGNDCAYYGGLAAYQCRSASPADFPVSWAIRLLEIAVKGRPTAPEVWTNLGHVHQEAGHAREARSCYERALTLDPTRIAAQVQIGNVFRDLGAPDRARWCFDLTRAMTPQTADDHYSRGLACFMLGDLAEGFREYEHRWSLVEWLSQRARPDIPQGITGRVLVHCEQGAGDALMVARWLPALRQQVDALTVEVPAPMVSLFARQWPAVTVVPFGTPVVCDQWVASMSLPHRFAVNGSADLVSAPYLTASPRMLPGALRVGIVWAGTASHKNDARRSTQVADWMPLLDVPGVTYYSLQVGDRAGECPAGVTGLTPELTDWSATASVLAGLDLLISVDSGCGHLAGALGVPTWLLLAAASDWRWGMEGEATAWYTGHRLFRQTRGGEWAPVVARVREALMEFSETRQAA